MTPEQKQQKLREWLPEIANACGFGPEWTWAEKVGPNGEDGMWKDIYIKPVDDVFSVTPRPYVWPTRWNPAEDDRDSAYMRRVFKLGVVWSGNFVEIEYEANDSKGCVITREPHDGTPDSMGEAERWAAIQAVAKKLGLE